MKSGMRIFLISFLTAVSLIICSCGSNDNHQKDQDDDISKIIVEAENKLVTMRVPQVSCPSCIGKIEAALKAEAGVVRYEVFKADERKQNVRVVYDPAKTNVDAIKLVITKLGKTAENVVQK